MATDYNDYFISRISQGNPLDGDSKFAQLQQASQDKIADLMRRKEAQLAQEKIDAKTWGGQLGLDPDSAADTLVNIGASAFSGATKHTGNALAAVFGAITGINQSQLSEEAIAALGRHEKGQSTAADLELINRKIVPVVPEQPARPNVTPETRLLVQQMAQARAQTQAEASPNTATPLSLWTQMNKGREVMAAIRSGADYTDRVRQGNREQMAQDLNSGFAPASQQFGDGLDAIKAGNTVAGIKDVVVGYAKLLMNAAAAAGNNPRAAAEYMAENAPQLLIGAVGKGGMALMSASNIGYGFDTYNKEIEAYQAKHNGALPPEKQRQEMALLSASLVVAEQGSDMIGLGVTKLAGQAAKDAARTSFVKALKGASTAAAGGVLAEMPTEGYQTWAEGEIAGKPATGAEIYTAGVIGGISGGGISGGGRAVHEAAKLAAQPSSLKASSELPPERAAIQDAAITTGDVSALLDPKHPAYAPDMAIAALVGHSKLPTTTEEQKQANVAKANEIISSLVDQRDEAKSYLRTPAEMQDELTGLRTELAAVDPTDPKASKLTINLQAAIKRQEADIAAEPLSKKGIQHYQNIINQTEKQLEQARTSQFDLNLVVTSNEKLEEHITSINKPVDTKASPDALAADAARSAASAVSVINLAMTSPDRLDPKVATQLAENTANALTGPQRAYLRAFSDAQVVENQLRDRKGVTNEVLNGSRPGVRKPNKGITQYRAAMSAALMSGDRVSASMELAGLTRFAKDHTAKGELAAQALKRGPLTQIHRTKNNAGWFIPQGNEVFTGTRKEIKAALAKNGGLAVNSKGLVQEIQAEATTLNAVAAELQAAYDLKFNPVTNGASNVQNTSQNTVQPGSEQQAQPEAKADQVAQPVGSSVAPASVGTTDVQPAAVVGTDVVETSGVTATQAQYDEAVRVKESTNESDYDNVPEDIAKLVTVLNDETAIQITPEKTTVNEEPLGSSVKTKDTEVTQSTEQTENTEEEVKSTTEVVATGLSVLQGKKSTDELPAGTKLGAVYRTMNRVVAFLTQRTNKNSEDIGTYHPLVSIPDFLSKWTKGEFHPSDLFAAELLEPEVGALNNFHGFAKKWAPLVRANLIKGGLPNSKGNLPTEAFKYEDPLQDFFNPDGSIDENVVTAIVYGAYNWLNESVRGAAYKDKEAILKMHGLRPGEDIEVSHEGYRSLSQMAGFKDNAATSLGAYVIDALGFKANKEVTEEYMANLASAFGLHGLVLLAQEEVDLIDLVSVNGAEMQTYLVGSAFPAVGTNTKGEPIYPTMTYVRVRRDSKGDLLTASASIKSAVAGSFGIVEGLFSTERSAQYASWEPVPFTQAMAKKTGQTVPKILQRILGKSSQVPNRVIPAMFDLIGVLGDKNFLAAAGHIEYDEHKIQKENLDSTLAKNSGLKEQLANTKSLVQNAIDFGGGIAQAFYVLPEVWRNFRIGSAASDLNMQTSKIQRFSFYRPEWESTINLQDTGSTTQFLVSIAQALGTKIDSKPNEDMLTAFMASTGQPDSQESKFAIAIHEALQSPDKAVMSEGMKQDIGVFAASKEGMQTLQALVMYGRYLDARNKFDASGSAADAKFTIQMVVGVDGKTNGPMLSFLAMGAADTKDALFSMLNRGGMYREKDGAKNFNHWYERATSLDLYEHIAAKILEGIPATEGLAAIYTFTKSLTEGGKITSAGRNFAKSPMTPLTFGSSINRSIGAMEEVFVQSVFDRIQAVADGSDKKTTRLALIKSLNLLMKTTIPESTPIEDLMARPFTKAEKLALADKFRSIIGGRIENAIGGVFNLFLQRRNEVNKNIQGAFGVYGAVRQDMYNAEMKLLMDSGDVAFKSVTDKTTGQVTREPLHGMKAEQLKALKEKLEILLPRANTAFTAESNDLASGLAMFKTSVKTGERLANIVKIQLGKLIPSANQTDHGKMVSRLLGASQEKVEISPGVAGFSYFIHSLDSYIMQLAIEDTHSLNVHDEAGNGVDNVIRTAKSINHATWTALLNFSPATEAYNLLVRTVEGAAALHKEGKISPQGLANIEYTLRGMLPYKARSMPTGQLIMTVLRAAHKGQRDANIMRLDGMSEMFYLDQYTWEGGQYDVTDKDRDEALAKLKTARENSAVSEETQAAAEALTAAFMGKPETESEVTPEVASVPDIQQDPIAEKSPFGELVAPGEKPDIAPDQYLVDYFNANPVSQASEVMNMLRTSKKLNAANSTLLQLIYRTLSVVNPKITVRYVTRNTELKDVLKTPGVLGRGWYIAMKDGRTEIYIVGTDFKKSGLTAEVLLHEMVHASIAAVIASPKTEAAKELIKELEALRIASLEYIDKQDQSGDLFMKYFAALSDIQEFVAWGMTNSDFQMEILNNLTFESKTTGNPLITGMAEFIAIIAKFLFQGMTPKQQKESKDGLGVLFTNVIGLFNQAAGFKIEEAAAPAKTEAKVADVTPDAPFKLNAGQQTAYDATVAFLKSAKKTFSVIGSAGTGKTTIVKTILDNLDKEGLKRFSRIILTSPTHRANAVTRSKNSHADIITLHSLLGLSPSVNLEEFDARNLKFAKKDNPEGDDTMPSGGLLIVDESSMINDELFKALAEAADAAGTKIIFLGDMAQLGPVKQNTDSKALTSTDGQSVLTQVMRAKNAALLDESVALRESGDFTAVNSMKQGNGVRFMNDSAAFISRAAKFFGSAEFKKNPLLVRVLAFRNASVAKYNKMIREAIHGKGAAPYVPGELLMGYAAFGQANETTKMPQIANGVDYLVQSVGPITTNTLYGVEVEVMSLLIKDVFGLNPTVVVWVVSPTTSAAKITEIGIAAQKLIIAAKKDRRQWKKFYKEKELFVLPFDVVADDNGRTQTLIVKTVDYGYAHTIHKSQGGTYNFVMVDANDVDAARTEVERKRLRYVGLTRAERGAFVLTDATVTQAEPEPTEINLAMAAQQDEIDAIHAYSTLDIHDALRDATAPLAEAFDNHLRGLLGGIVEKLYGPFGAFKATVADKIAFTTEIDASPLPSSDQESFAASQVEATVRAVLDQKETVIKTAYKDLAALYDEMNRALNRDGRDFYTGDWSKATPNEKAIAQAERDFIFNIIKVNGDKSDYLARFAALGLANEKFNQILKRATERDTKRVVDATTWEDRLQTIFSNILEFFHSRLMGTYKGQPADAKLAILVGHLVALETREKNFLVKAAENKFLEPVDGMVKIFSDAIRVKVEAAAKSDFVRDNKNLLVRTTGTVVRTIAGNRVDLMLDGMQKWRDANIAGQQGVIASLMQEYRGYNKAYLAMLRIRKMFEADRHKKSEIIGQTAMSTFADGGKALSGRNKESRAMRTAITSVFLRTGAHNLLDHFSSAEIEHLLNDRASLDATITDFKDRLKVFGSFAPYFFKQANVLAANKVFGGARDGFLQQNAYVISRMLGTPQEGKITDAQARDAEKIIKPLIALYALRYSDTQDLVNAHKVLRTENARKDGNGVDFILKAHQLFEAESLDRVFNNDPTQMIHGYTPEIYDPRVTVVTANAAEGKDLKAQGYIEGATLFIDKADPNREAQRIYTLKDGGLTRRVSAIFAMQSQHAKGSLVHSGYLNSNTVMGLANAVTNADILQDRAAAINALFQPGLEPDLSNVKSNHMAPVYNLNGEIVNWRYMMLESTKDVLLKRDNRFDKVLGTLAGSIFDKATTQERNQEPIQALKEQYDSEQSKDPRGYMLVGQASTDPELKENWNLLPDATQQDIQKIWGYKGMMVKVDTLDIMFGYRKLSAADMFRKDPKARHAWEKLIAYFGEQMFGQKAGLRVTQIERGLQELLGEAKDIILVKSGTTMLRNFRSNMWQLYMSGVPLTDILSGHLTAWKAANLYQDQSAELGRLRLLKETGYTQGKDAEIAHQIAVLEDAITRNPSNKLIGGGLMPTIQEDLDPEDDLYSYMSAATRTVQDFTDALNPHIMSAAKYVYMAHDTPLYQGLRKATQLSDFMARYVMYQHLTTRKENPLSHADALNDSSAAFVNYDVPMHRLLQYSDDMGLTLFTKYFLRMQGVLAKMVQDNPARVLSSVLFANYLGLGSTVLEDSSMWAKIGNNPIQSGPWKFFESFDELTTINSAMSVFQTGAAAPAIKAVGKVAGLPV